MQHLCKTKPVKSVVFWPQLTFGSTQIWMPVLFLMKVKRPFRSDFLWQKGDIILLGWCKMDLEVCLGHFMQCKPSSYYKWKSGQQFSTEFLRMLLGRCSINPLLLIKQTWDWWLQESIWTPQMCHMMVSDATFFHNYIFNVYWTATIQMFKAILNVNSFILFISIIRINEKISFRLFFWTSRQHLYQPGHNILCFSFQTQNR